MAVFRGRLAGFVAIPKGAGYEEILRLIEEAFNAHGVEVITSPCSFTPDILEGCRKADLLIADISDNNPSTYYIIGVSQVLQKPVLILSQDEQKIGAHSIPYEISGQKVVRYMAGHTGRLADYLKHWLADISSNQNELAN